MPLDIRLCCTWHFTNVKFRKDIWEVFAADRCESVCHCQWDWGRGSRSSHSFCMVFYLVVLKSQLLGVL